MARHRERPIKRVNPSGRTRWVARYTAADSRRLSAGTFRLEREAQDAIDAAYEIPRTPDTVGAYLAGWTTRHPRTERTNDTNEHRIGRVLDVKLEGRQLRHWPIAELRRRHALDLVDHMLREQHRAPSGAVNILRALSAMCEDAITDEIAGSNPFKGVRVRASDPRAVGKPRPARVFTFEQLHAFAAAAPDGFEPMLRTLIDCGLRLGELLGLERRDLVDGLLIVRGSAYRGAFVEGDQPTKRHERVVPVPPTLAAMLSGRPTRIDTPLLFPTLRGLIWREDNFRNRIWLPTRTASGLDVRPQDCRHSFVSNLRAAGIDPADLADIAGHSVETATARYTHALRRSFDEVRRMVG